jgi:aryl-alcohol dehydrogenase-like predicted oxidoreductase/predicted kinase/histidinol phosphatase-like enzyme
MNPRPIALGCMRLSTEPDRNDDRSIAVLHAAFDAGVTLLETADAYCWDESERGHNERLIARAISTWPARPPMDPDTKAGTATTARSFPGRNFCEGARPQVATKGGLTRPDGRWEPDGRAKHLIAACERSCRALGVERIDLYQLHTPDSRTPLATSVRALAALRRNGLIRSIGLCNVTVGQIEEARRIVEIDSIQVEASVWHDAAFLSGVADYCIASRLTLLAYRPLGGRKSRARTAADPALNAVAARHGVTPFEVALAWLADLSDLIVPLPGVTRVETARSAAAALKITLTDDDRKILDERFPAGRSIREGSAPRASVSIRQDAEVVLVMGLPGAGKTTLAERFVADGYQRLNRDEAGGTLRELLPELDRALADGVAKVVLDNTYLSRKSRAEVIRAAAERGARVRCIWLATTLEDAQVNAVERLVSRYDRLPEERELNALRKRDVAAFLPTAQFRAQRELEPPDAAEGFSRIEVVPFERRIDPAHVNRAVIVWCDDVLLRSRSGRRRPTSADDVLIVEARVAVLRRYQAEGWQVLGLSWQPEVAEGSRSAADVHAVFARMNQLIAGGDKPSSGDKPAGGDKPSGLSIPVEYCPHPAGPPRCWCRKPLPGLGVSLIHRHRLDPAQCIYVGEGAQDPGFARKLGFRYIDAKDFFGDLAIS